MTSKCSHLYNHALHFTVVAADWQCEPPAVTMDFEVALINQIRYQFPRAKLNGCLFHFKQATRRYCENVIKMEEGVIKKLMEKGMLDLLSIIPLEDIKVKGIQYLKNTIQNELDLSDEEDKQLDVFGSILVDFGFAKTSSLYGIYTIKTAITLIYKTILIMV